MSLASLSRAAVCCAFLLLSVFLEQAPVSATDEKNIESAPANTNSLETMFAGRRYSAIRSFSKVIPENDALLVAETAARAEAMRSVVRYLITIPGVRIATSATPSPVKTPNLLALAHATVKTSLLLVSKSRKDSTVTVTVSLDRGEASPSLEERIREALVNPDRMELYEKAVLRELTLIEDFDALIPVLDGKSKTTEKFSYARPERTPEEAMRAIVNELKALAIFKDQLPSRNGLWENPASLLDIMSQALVLSPESALCHNAKGDASLQLGRSQEAMEEQIRAIKIDPLFARAYHSRGAAALTLGHFSSAVSDFSEAIRLSPDTAAYHQARGMAYHLMGETTLMCRDFHRACSFGRCEEMQWAVAKNLCPAG